MKCIIHIVPSLDEKPVNGCKRCWDAWNDRMASEIHRIRAFLKRRFPIAMISGVHVETGSKRYRIKINTSKRGVILGKEGLEIAKAKQELRRMTTKEICLIIVRIDAVTNAQLIAESIARRLGNHYHNLPGAGFLQKVDWPCARNKAYPISVNWQKKSTVVERWSWDGATPSLCLNSKTSASERHRLLKRTTKLNPINHIVLSEIQMAMDFGVIGIKTCCTIPSDGTRSFQLGSTHSIEKSALDYGFSEALTNNGIMKVQCWVYNKGL